MALYKQSYTWPRIAWALARWVERETGLSADAPPGTVSQVSWADYDQGPLVKPFVSIQSIAPATSLGFPQESMREVPTQQLLTITQTVVGELVTAYGIWSTTETTVQGGDLISDTRDKFLAAWQATIDETQEPLIFASSGADGIAVTAKPFAIPDVEAVQGCALAVPAPVVADAWVNSVTRRYRVRFQLYAFAVDGDDASDEYVSQLQVSLESRDGINFLAQYGVGVEGTPTQAQDASAISGPLRERRVFFDASIVTRRLTYDTRNAVPIELVDPPVIEGVLGDPQDPSIISTVIE